MKQTTLVNSENKSLVAWLLLSLLAMMWGGSFIIIKKGLADFTPTQIATIRMAAAGLVFIPYLLTTNHKFPKNRALPIYLSGFLGYLIPSFLFAFAGSKINSSLSGTLNSTTPIFVLIIGILFFKQVFEKSQLAGLILGFLGSIILVLSSSKTGLSFDNPYALLVVFATVMYGFNVNIVGKLRDLNPISLTAWSFFPVAIVSLIILFSTDFVSRINTNTLPTLLLIILLGAINSGLATIIFNYIMQISSPVFASSVTYLIPIVATIIGIFAGESISFLHYFGMMIILIGVYLVNKK